MAINASTYLIYIDTITPITAERGNIANYRPVVCGTGNSFNMSIAEIDISNKCDGGWRNTRPGYGSWGFDVDGFAVGLKTADRLAKANFQELLSLALDKKLFWACMCDIDRTIAREGVVWINSFDETANNNEAYGFSASMTGTKKPITSTDLFITLLATNSMGNQFLEDGNDNLIEVVGNGEIIQPLPGTGGDTWNDNATWGG